VYVCILALVIQYANRMRLHNMFPRHLINGMIFRDKKFTEYKMCVPIFSTTLVIYHSKNDSARYYHKCTQVLMWSTHFLSDFNQNRNLFNRYLKNPQISNFTKIRCSWAVPCRQMNKRTDMMKITVTFAVLQMHLINKCANLKQIQIFT